MRLGRESPSPLGCIRARESSLLAIDDSHTQPTDAPAWIDRLGSMLPGTPASGRVFLACGLPNDPTCLGPSPIDSGSDFVRIHHAVAPGSVVAWVPGETGPHRLPWFGGMKVWARQSESSPTPARPARVNS